MACVNTKRDVAQVKYPETRIALTYVHVLHLSPHIQILAAQQAANRMNDRSGQFAIVNQGKLWKRMWWIQGHSVCLLGQVGRNVSHTYRTNEIQHSIKNCPFAEGCYAIFSSA